VSPLSGSGLRSGLPGRSTTPNGDRRRRLRSRNLPRLPLLHTRLPLPGRPLRRLAPEVGKCSLCEEAVTSETLDQPACTAACPTGATIFGDRDLLLAEAHRRIAAEPKKYIDHVYGEHELGGTSVLYISDVDLVHAGWPPHTRASDPITGVTNRIMHTVPYTFVGVGLGLAGVSWVVGRRMKLAAKGAVTDTDLETGDNVGKLDSEEKM